MFGLNRVDLLRSCRGDLIQELLKRVHLLCRVYFRCVRRLFLLFLDFFDFVDR